MLPEPVRIAAVRKLARINSAWPSPSLEIKIADTEEELACAYRLLHASYVDAGFMTPDPSGMRVLPQHMLPETTTIVAKWDGNIIGTLSLIRDNPLGLPIDKIFDISTRRAGGRRIAEVSSLALDPRFRGQANRALFPLFRFVYHYARHYFGTSEFVIAVNPSTVDMYLSLMCFERLSSKTKSYDFVNGAPAVGLFLDFESCEEKWKKAFAHLPEARNFLKYWSEIPTHPGNRLPIRRYHSSSDPIVTPELLGNFFMEKAQLARRLKYEEIQVLRSAYPYPEFEAVLKPLLEFVPRKTLRMATQMKAEIGPDRISGEVWNVSREGVLLRAQRNCLAIGQAVELAIWLNSTTKTKLQTRVRWSSPEGLFGLQITLPSVEWARMIEFLESDYGARAKLTLKAS